MNYTRSYMLGDKELKLNADTKISIRLATDDEITKFKNSHWSIPPFNAQTCGNKNVQKNKYEEYVKKFKFQTELWGSLCQILSEIYDDIDSLWSSRSPKQDAKDKIYLKFVDERYTIDEHKKNSKWRFDDDKSKEMIPRLDGCKFNLESDRTITITSRYWYTVTEYDILNENKEHTSIKYIYAETLINYPNDFLRLLDALKEYLEYRKKPQKGFFGNLKDPILSTCDKNILYFFESRAKAIEQFKKYVYCIKYIKKAKEEAERAEKEAERAFRESLPKEYLRFCSQEAHNVLDVDGEIFFEGFSGFDIYKKQTEIKEIIVKIQRCNDDGEREVEYALKWFFADTEFNVVEITKNCESKYRYGCILLCKPDFIDEPQEYDHILVSEVGVILIETKNWKGRVEIRPDGKWIRDNQNDENVCGERNPVIQIKRHEKLMKKILPNVPVYSMLCFSNRSVILDGADNCESCRIVYVDNLEDILTSLISSSDKMSAYSVDDIVDIIEKHKVNKSETNQNVT